MTDRRSAVDGRSGESVPAAGTPAEASTAAPDAWCSSDPVCIESVGTGVDALNLAACHACLLVLETSCKGNNTFLDRATLVGTPADPDASFFSELLRR